MPQLDRIIVFSQIFWLFVVFTSFYIILTHFFLPIFLKSLKSRKQIVDVNLIESLNIVNRINEKQTLLKQTLLKNLLVIENSIISDFIASDLIKNKINTQLIDEKIGFVSFNISLYCDYQLLQLIQLFPKSLNLKYKN